jgi:hypothetical protein
MRTILCRYRFLGKSCTQEKDHLADRTRSGAAELRIEIIILANPCHNSRSALDTTTASG